MAKKAVQMKGGVGLGESNPTWLKQEGDVMTNYIGIALGVIGLVQLGFGHYKLATGKGKMD